MIKQYRLACCFGIALGCFLAAVTATLFFGLSDNCAVPFLSFHPEQARPEMLSLHILATIILTIKNLQQNGFWFLIVIPLTLCGLVKLDQSGEKQEWAWSLSKSFWLVAIGDFCVAIPWGMASGFVDTEVAKYLPYQLWYGVQASCFLVACSVITLIAPFAFVVSFSFIYAIRKARKRRAKHALLAATQTIGIGSG